ncbi:PREDICTED: basic proline-rich protein-like [Capra hircus]|uniref:basic proline-rich protein-like n=1 Tax=Capra hircus TaxID=9925 RepID=UPI000847CF35|nr:PREDICTED: basic proline-rich protein-like [Capra hircus]
MRGRLPPPIPGLPGRRPAGSPPPRAERRPGLGAEGAQTPPHPGAGALQQGRYEMQASDAFPEKAVAGSPEKGQKEALPGILSLRPSPCLSALFPETPTKWRVQRMFPAKSWSLGLFVPPREVPKLTS